MSRNRRIALTLCSLAGLSTFWSGCSAAKQTELVAGVSTQVRVPRDIRTVRVDVTRNGAPFLCRAYRVYDGKVLLPRTLGTIPAGSTSDAITISITGFTAAESEPGFNAFTDECLVSPGVSKDKGEGGGARVLRRARLPYDPDVIRFVPMPLRYSCFDKECDPNNTGEKTCKAGQCVDAGLDVTTLKKFTPGLADGTDSSCFSPKVCFPEPGVPAQPIDLDSCVYAVPKAEGAPASVVDIPKTGDGINVRVVYDGGFTKEILDLDAEEGFSIPDPKTPQIFKLARGLCEMVKGVDADGLPTAHRISAIQTFGFCQPKTLTQPICADEANKIMTGSEDGVANPSDGTASCLATNLTAAPSALLLLAEKSKALTDFYSLSGLGDQVHYLLQDPIFEKLEVAFKFLPGTLTACGDTLHLVADVGLGLASANAEPIVKLFNDAGIDPAALPNADTKMFYDLVLNKTTGTIKPLFDSSAPLKSLVVLGNHGFKSDCSATALSSLVADAKTAGISSRAIVLGPEPTSDGSGAVATFGADAVTNAVVGATDKVSDKNNEALRALGSIVAELTTCVYDAPAGLTPASPDLTTSKVVFYKNFPDAASTFGYSADCKTANTADGPGLWGFDGVGHVVLCQEACKVVRTSHAAEAAVAAGDHRRAQAMPVVIQAGCGTTIP